MMNTQTQPRTSGQIGGSQRSPVQESLDVQGKELSELHTVISTLENRLRPVRNIPPACDSEKECPSPDPVMLTAKIDQATRAVAAATSRLNALIGELIV